MSELSDYQRLVETPMIDRYEDRLRRLSAHALSLKQQLSTVTEERDRAREALSYAREYFDDRADAELQHGDSGFHPNEEMKLLTIVEQALTKEEES